MTAVPQTLYRCDRCGRSEYVSATTNPPMHERVRGPDKWVCLKIGVDPSTPPSHLCPTCGMLFESFMSSQQQLRAGGVERDLELTGR